LPQPQPTRRFGDLDPEATAAHRALALALRALCEAVGGTRKSIAESLHVSEPKLSAHLNARRTRPDRQLIADLHILATTKSGSNGVRALSELTDLLGQALRSTHLCWSCQAEMQTPPAAEQAAAEQAAAEQAAAEQAAAEQAAAEQAAAEQAAAEQAAAEQAAGPAARIVRPRMRTRTWEARGRVDTLKRIAGTAVRRTLPVPPPQGDRQLLSVPDRTWAPFADLARHLGAGRAGDARTILQHSGTATAPTEVADAVATCRGGGLDEAAEAILHYAGTRGAADALRIVRVLNARQQYSDAEVLLRSALEE